MDAPRSAPARTPRRVLVSWCLYDFGNSAFAVLFPTFFAHHYRKHVVGGDVGRADLWWGAVTTTAMLLVALTAPFAGGIADHAGVRKRMLAAYTAAGIVAVLLFPALGPGAIVVGWLLGALADFAFEGGAVFYNAYLPEIAPPSHQGRLSGLGFATGYAGSLVALGYAKILADAGRLDWVWTALALQWTLGALPGLLWLPADPRLGLSVVRAAREGFRRTLRTLREVVRMPDLAWFLLAAFFFMNGVNTVVYFAGPYAEGTFGFTIGDVMVLFAIVQLAALLGSLAMARPTDTKGPRWAVRLLLLWWSGVVLLAAALPAGEADLFYGVSVLAGLGLGGVQAASRALMARLIPAGREAELFALYALCGKTGSVLGPLIFGLVSYSPGRQRPAVLSVAAFFAIGLVLLHRVRPEAVRPVPTPITG